MQKQLLKHGKFYVAFFDFKKKAFDLVDRRYLGKILLKNGIRERIYRAVMTMYEVVKERVRVVGGVINAFECSRGLKQGEYCSPSAFSFLINDLANEVEQCEKHCINLSPYLIQVLIMLFADGVQTWRKPI